MAKATTHPTCTPTNLNIRTRSSTLYANAPILLASILLNFRRRPESHLQLQVSEKGLEEVLGLGVKVVSISGAKGKKIIEARQWKSQPYRQARAERSAIESLVFTLKEGFEFGEMVRRTHENVLAEMLEKMLAYNISQIIRVRKKLSELQEMQRAAA